MPSPFPGMNPYIERPELWNDFHNTFIPTIREFLAPLIQPRYFVRIEENVFIHEPPAHERFPLGKPDISVHPTSRTPPVAPSNSVAVLAPATVGMPVIVDESRLPYLEIRDRARNDTVTIVELLSPASKATGVHRDLYISKVQRILASRTNFVEIDLLRGGPRMPWERLPSCDYYAIVSRPADRNSEEPHAGLWPIGLRDPLPTIPIPLRADEPEPTLDLQVILHRIYDTAGYQLFIYDSDPEPPLSGADAVWAAQLVNLPA